MGGTYHPDGRFSKVAHLRKGERSICGLNLASQFNKYRVVGENAKPTDEVCGRCKAFARKP